jgi:hypothetical protein
VFLNLFKFNFFDVVKVTIIYSEETVMEIWGFGSRTLEIR